MCRVRGPAQRAVSVIATFKEAGARGRLLLLVESESLFNDGTAAVLFAVCLEFAAGQSLSAVQMTTRLAVTIGGSLICGAIVSGGALLLASATAFTVVKLFGAAYLVYIGVALLRSRAAAEIPRQEAAAPLRRVFLQGLLTNVLNPKVALFFVAFLPQFVVPDAPHQFAALLVLGLIFNLNGTIWNLLVAALATRGRNALTRRTGTNWISRVTGGLLVVLGVRLAFLAPP